MNLTGISSKLGPASWSLWLVTILAMAPGATHANGMETEVAQFDMIIIGASYAEGWHLESVGEHSVLNVGIGGEETGQMLDRFEQDVVSRRPKAVVIWGLINDVFRSPAGEMSATEEQVKANYLAMIDMAMANGIKVVLASEVTMGPKAGFSEWIRGVVGRARGKVSYQERINANVSRINLWLRETSQQKGLTFLDFEKVLAGDNGMRLSEYCQPDGSHISDLGYSALTEYARPILMPVFD